MENTAANLVNTVCGSCHLLDRVKNKTADNAGWTTTVTRMKEKGANLTDEQVPVVVEFLTRAAGTLTVAPGGRGGGRGPRTRGESKSFDPPGRGASQHIVKIRAESSVIQPVWNYAICVASLPLCSHGAFGRRIALLKPFRGRLAAKWEAT